MGVEYIQSNDSIWNSSRDQVIENQKSQQKLFVLENNPDLYAHLDLIHSTFNAHSTLFYEYDVIKQIFKLREAISHQQALVVSDQVTEGIFQLALKLDDVSHIFDDHRLIKNLKLYTQPVAIASLWLVPIFRKSHLLGLLILDYRAYRELDFRLRGIVKKFAQQLAKQLVFSRQQEKFRRFENEISLLYHANTDLNRCWHKDDVMRTFFLYAKKITSFDEAFMIERLTSEAYKIFLASVKNRALLPDSEIELPSQKSLARWCIDNNQPLYYDNYTTKHHRSFILGDAMQLPNTYDTVLIYPVSFQNENFGAAVFLHRSRDAFSIDQRRIIEMMGQVASASIKNALTLAELERKATIDGLTGLTNHRCFQETLDQEVKRAERYHHKLCLLLLDIDHFKSFNDTHGHPVGDAVLKSVATQLKDMTRENDTAARYGGEEFALILVNTNAQAALLLAERIRTAIERTQRDVAGLHLNVTMSVGLTEFKPGLTKSRMIELADQALYQSKEKGRNCTSVKMASSTSP